ncbi:MAG: helix-hairpin-helix domain-containing protein [Candidatus Micrarchaeota archaeon]|nr:helix-hairpin-helix domain-containing protein [Candidatus Micrarchaeota archaeon]
MPEEKKPKIMVDTREPDSVCDALEAQGAEIEVRQLEIGDYLLSDRLVAERKTRADFESSVVDGRLFAQASDLCAALPRVVIIVEGDAPEGSRLSRSALLGAYASLISDFGCALFFTRSPPATAEMLYALAHHEQVAKSRAAPVYAKRKARSVAERQRAVVEALPNVGPALAEALLKYFDTVENVMSAPESELREVGRIGEKKASELRKLLSTRYMPARGRTGETGGENSA